jgi:hypothetical protein
MKVSPGGEILCLPHHSSKQYSVHPWGWIKGWTFPLGGKAHPWGRTMLLKSGLWYVHGAMIYLPFPELAQFASLSSFTNIPIYVIIRTPTYVYLNILCCLEYTAFMSILGRPQVLRPTGSRWSGSLFAQMTKDRLYVNITPGTNPTIVSFNATNSLAHF